MAYAMREANHAISNKNNNIEYESDTMNQIDVLLVDWFKYFLVFQRS